MPQHNLPGELGDEPRAPAIVSLAAYRAACDEYLGWCSACADFTRDSTEPDARGPDYRCPVCDAPVVGAEEALLIGAITVE